METKEVKEIKGPIKQVGQIRFCLHFPGEKRTVETGRMVDDESGNKVKEVREVQTLNIIYGDWCGGSAVPLKIYSEVCRGASSMQVHLKRADGTIEVVHEEAEPEKITFNWLAFVGLPNSDMGGSKKPRTYIRGAEIVSPKTNKKQFIVVEGI